jgi:hypothetical protein
MGVPAYLEEFSGADFTYISQVEDQVQRVTSELNKLDAILSAGMVDRTVLMSFRDAVNRIRHTGWAMQQRVDEKNGVNAKTRLAEDRIRVVNQMLETFPEDVKDVPASSTDALYKLKLNLANTILAINEKIID